MIEYQNYFANSSINIEYINEDKWDACRKDDELIITSIFNEKFKKQFCFRRKRIGIGGVEVLLSKLSQMIVNNRSLGHE